MMTNATALNTPTILLIDDVRATVRSFATILSSEGYLVRTATDADTGLREALASRPDAIIVDLHMPRVDGVEFVRRLRMDDQNRHTPVAVVTGDYSLDDATRTTLDGLQADVAFKPLWVDDILALTRTLLARES
jgi:CheY-like chemotaxis protein